jgi:hypothetical protein
LENCAGVCVSLKICKTPSKSFSLAIFCPLKRISRSRRALSHGKEYLGITPAGTGARKASDFGVVMRTVRGFALLGCLKAGLNSEEKKPKSQEKEPKSHVLIYRVLRGEKNVPPVIPQISLPHIDGSIGCVSHLVNDILDRCSRSSLSPRHLEADVILEHSNACQKRHRGGDSRPLFQLGIVSLVCLDGARDRVRVCRPG